MAVIPTPIYRDGYVYVASGYGVGCNLFKITSDGGKFSAKEVYANEDMTNHHGGVVLIDNYLYGFCDGKGWTCMDFRTGKVAWRNKGVGKGSLVYADGLLYLRRKTGRRRRNHRSLARRLQGTGPLQSARPQRQAQLAAPGRHRRPALSSRSGRVAVLRREIEVATDETPHFRQRNKRLPFGFSLNSFSGSSPHHTFRNLLFVAACIASSGSFFFFFFFFEYLAWGVFCRYSPMVLVNTTHDSDNCTNTRTFGYSQPPNL